MTRKAQGRIGQNGAELGSTLNVLKEYGCCLDINWPFIPIRQNKEPCLTTLEEASKYKLEEYSVLDSVNFKEYLNCGIPVVIGMHIGRKFLRIIGELSEQSYEPISDVNRYSRGHAVTIIGYNEDSWIIANSMGLKWGDRGFGVIPFECNTDIGEAYAIKRFAGFAAEKKIPTIDK